MILSLVGYGYESSKAFNPLIIGEGNNHATKLCCALLTKTVSLENWSDFDLGDWDVLTLNPAMIFLELVSKSGAML